MSLVANVKMTYYFLYSKKIQQITLASISC